MHPLFIAARGLLKSDEEKAAKRVCPTEDHTGPAIVPFVGNLTYHQFSSILAGACALLSTFIVLVLIVMHAINYSNPVQQRQIIRIALLVPYVAFFSFLIVKLDGAGEYLVESLDFGCAIALSAFLLFMCDLILSHPGGFEQLFNQTSDSDKKSPPSLRRLWYGVLQFIPTTLIVWVATIISLAVGTYCKASNSIHFAHIWLTIIKVIVATIAIVSALKFYGQHKATLSQHGILLKLFTFKGIIGLNVIQTFIISILAGQNVLEPSKYMTYHDINTALPKLILACEMPIFAILIFVAFAPAPYKKSSPAATSLSAIVDAFNISDLLSAFVRGPMRLVRDQQRQILRQNSVRVDMGAGEGDDEVRRWEERRGGNVV